MYNMWMSQISKQIMNIGNEFTGVKQNSKDKNNQKKDLDHDQEGEEEKMNVYLKRFVPEEPTETNGSNEDVNHLSISDNIEGSGSNGFSFDVNDNTGIDKTLSSRQRRNINTLSQLISVVNTSTVGTEFDQLVIPNEGRVLLERFIDALSRLAVDIFLDPTRREEIIRRLNSSTRALEGF